MVPMVPRKMLKSQHSETIRFFILFFYFHFQNVWTYSLLEPLFGTTLYTHSSLLINDSWFLVDDPVANGILFITLDNQFETIKNDDVYS